MPGLSRTTTQDQTESHLHLFSICKPLQRLFFIIYYVVVQHLHQLLFKMQIYTGQNDISDWSLAYIYIYIHIYPYPAHIISVFLAGWTPCFLVLGKTRWSNLSKNPVTVKILASPQIPGPTIRGDWETQFVAILSSPFLGIWMQPYSTIPPYLPAHLTR